jgi:membrane peptidoglycan carboxypeptidase
VGRRDHGAEAASRTYFGEPAADLDAGEAALLAGAIFNPRVLNPARPSPGLLRRQRLILERMGIQAPPSINPGAAGGAISPPQQYATPSG